MLSVFRFSRGGVLGRVLGLSALAALLFIAGCGSNSSSTPTPTVPSLSAAVAGVGNLTHGQTGASYSITVSNAAGAAATSGTITVTDPPTNFTVTAVSGTGWACVPPPTVMCTRSDALPAGQSYPPITVTGNVTGATGQPISIPITISGGGITSTVTASPSIPIVAAPAITSGNSTTFTVGTGGTFTVTATGFPAPTFTEMGALPSGVTLNSTTGVLSGTPAAGSGGTYPITITAQNSVTPNATQSFTLTVDEAAKITTAASTTFMVNTAGTFTVMATGFPAPTLSETGAPTGVTFNASTGVLSGTATATGAFPIMFTAHNGIGTDFTQNFTLTVASAPAITSGSSTTFTVGTAGTFTVTASGFPTPTFSETGTLPSGVSLSSAGVLSGTPAAGTGKSYSITITASNGVTPNASQSFTLTVDQAPAITSGTSTTFTVGTAGTFTAMATGFPAPTFSETGALPTGVSLNSTTGVLSGTPASATQGSYPIVITAQNGVGTNATQNFTLTVGLAPAFTSGNNTTFTVGTAGTFTVTATGFPAPTFGETGALPSGVALNSTTGVLSGTPGSGTGGSYPITITAQNGITPNATQSFTLTVNAPPLVTLNPTNQTAAAGSNATFTAAAGGNPAPTVQWQVSTSGGPFTNISGATSTTLTLTGVTTGQNGNQYQAVFTNSLASVTTSAATLTVTTAPAITLNPSNQTVTAGNNATFTAAASGTPTPTVQWQVSVSGGAFTNISGATSTTLTLTAVTDAQNGNKYQAVFTNSFGNATTAPATLTVDDRPIITQNPTNQSVAAGGTATFTAAATGPPPITTVQWQVSTGGGPFTNISGATSTTLTLTGVTTGQNGNQYQAVFTNALGSTTTSAATLTVTTAPAITLSPSNQTVTAGNNATFTAAASGTPTPTVQWQVSVSGGAFTNISGATSTTLTLTAVTAAQNGNQYRAVFTNSGGNATTTAATLTVDFAPTITSNASTTASSGVAGSFMVTTTGFPIPTITETLTLPTGVSFADNGNNTGTLSWTTAVTTGTYNLSFTASNGIGSNATQSFTLTVSPGCTSNCTISGNVSGPVPSGVTITLSAGPTTKPNTTTDSSGFYSFSGLTGGTYVVRPFLPGYTFTPDPAAVTTSTSTTTQNFTETSALTSYSITGTLTYSGTKTGSFRTFIRVYSTTNTCTGNCGGATAATSLAAEPSSTGTTYTVRGLQQGTYRVVAEIDTLNNGAPNASNPWGSFSTVTIDSSSPANVSVPSFALTDPTPPALVAPVLNSGDAVPGSTFVLVQYDQHNSNALEDSNGREIATSYKVYYDTNSSFTHNTFAAFAAHGTHDNNYIVRNLGAGTYFFKVSALNANGEVASSTVSAVVGAGTGAFTFSGTVTFPGTATGPLYVGLYNGTTIYAQTIQTPFTSPVSFLVTGVPAGNYQAFAIIDQNNNGLIEPTDISNVTSNHGGPPPLTISTSNVTGYTIALTSAVSTVNVNTSHQQNLSNTPTDTYNLNFGIDWGTKRPVAMTLLSGPNVAVPWDLPVDTNNGEGTGVPNNVTPMTGDTYQFQVTFSDGSTQTMPVSITVLNSFVTGMTAQTTTPGSPTVPLFTWVAPSSHPSSYTYYVGLNSINSSTVNVNWNDHGGHNSNGLPSSTTSVLFNADGSATNNGASISSLPTGTQYQWYVGVQDDNGDSSQETSTYNN